VPVLAGVTLVIVVGGAIALSTGGGDGDTDSSSTTTTFDDPFVDLPGSSGGEPPTPTELVVELSADGTVATVSWEPGPGGLDVDTYIVQLNGETVAEDVVETTAIIEVPVDADAVCVTVDARRSGQASVGQAESGC
jgi:hypothetical protein